MDKLYVENYKDGRFRYVYRYFDPMTRKMKRITCVKDKNTKQTYNEALRELQDKAYQLSIDKHTLQEITDLYEKDKSRILKAQTLSRNMSVINQINKKIGTEILMENLNVPIVKNALLELSTTNVMFNQKLLRYKAFLNWCFENEYTDNCFWKKIHPLPDNKKKRIEDKYLESDELKILLDSMDDYPLWYYVTYFLVLSGLRIGELIALEDSDVDNYIHVTKSYELQTGDVGTTKTLESTREVYVQTELNNLIRRIRLFQKEYKFRYNIKSPLFICSPKGSYISYNAYRKYLRIHSIKSIGRKITPHALRHTSASLLLEQGVPLDTVAKRLGHTSSEITKEIYIHMTEKMKKREEEMIQNVQIL